MNITTAQVDTLKASLNTVEKWVTWGGLLLHRQNKILRVNEVENYSDFALQATMATDFDGNVRLYLRQAIKLDPDFPTKNPGRLWLNALDFPATELPTAFIA